MNLIVAVDNKWAIGYKNDLLISIPDDMKFFRETTTGNVIIMGRKTLNSFPNVLCGHIEDPTDAYLFSQINAGNAVAIGYAKGFGWGSELTLTYIFEKLFESDFGGGYPKERVVPEQANKKISYDDEFIPGGIG